MRIITLHCDYIKFKALKKALKSAPEADKDEKEVKEPLVVLTAVEQGDTNQTIQDLVDSVKKTAKEVKATNLVLYPYAHLSSSLASPTQAVETLEEAEKLLKKEKSFKVYRAPFGYYKSFELKCKGHPLSELSKEFRTEVKGSCCPEPSKGKVVEENYDPKQLLREISRSKLDTSKLKDHDHRILAQKLDLFSFNDVSPGSVFWHHNGKIIYNELVQFVRELILANGYEEIATPQILDNRLWKVSGHWDHYQDSMFLTKYEDRDFGVKPMNCPGGMLIYRTKTRSYKDLPIRSAEFGLVHRQELSGVLSGLFRVIQFTQDDAHIFCTEDQMEGEIVAMLDLMKQVYERFGLKSEIELSTRPEKYMGPLKDWKFAENTLESVLKKKKIKYKINKGDGAFYGPKIDIHLKDSLKRSWQCGTIQLDMQMPERFDIKYIGKDGKEHTPFVFHRVIYGSLERFVGILLEHLKGNLPVWLSPTQVRVISFTERNVKSVEKTLASLKKEIPGLRIDTDTRNTTVNDKIREAELMKIPYIVVIGDKEEESKTLAVRQRGSKPKFKVKSEDLVKELKKKIEDRES